MAEHKVGTPDEWSAARAALLERERELNNLDEEVAKQREELPWVRVEKEYVFDTEEGKKSLAELFDGRSQLLIYHLMFGPSYEVACPGCTGLDRQCRHRSRLRHRGVARLERLQARGRRRLPHVRAHRAGPFHARPLLRPAA